MKINIGPYPDRLTCDIHNKYMDKKYGFYEWSDNKTKFDKFMEWLESSIQSLYNVLNWIWFDRRKQKVSIKIDKWDTWGMDYTLALIILPMIKQLQATKHGSPIVDLEDVPEELRPSSEEKSKLKEYESDSKFHQRWDWVLNEIIWTFEQKVKDDWMSDYYVYADDESEPLGIKLVKKDDEGAKKHQDRMNNGFRLFGKYYESLWD